jgi:hypothetical protein
VFTDARPQVEGDSTNGRSPKELVRLLASFEPADRAWAGHELVTGGLARSADPLLEHVANEFDDRVLTAIARAVVAVPAEAKESRRVRQLRAWADSELERLALEEAFLGREPEPVDLQFDPAPPGGFGVTFPPPSGESDAETTVTAVAAVAAVPTPDADTLELQRELAALASPVPTPPRPISWRLPGHAPTISWHPPASDPAGDR